MDPSSSLRKAGRLLAHNYRQNLQKDVPNKSRHAAVRIASFQLAGIVTASGSLVGHKACKPLTARSTPRKDGTTIWSSRTDRDSETLISCPQLSPSQFCAHVVSDSYFIFAPEGQHHQGSSTARTGPTRSETGASLMTRRGKPLFAREAGSQANPRAGSGPNTWLLMQTERRLVPIANDYAFLSLLAPTGELLGLRAPMRTHRDGFLHTASFDHYG